LKPISKSCKSRPGGTGKLSVRSLIDGLSKDHYLSCSPGDYKAGFVAATNSVYPATELGRILQRKFFIPDDSRFNLETYLQSAVELSVQNDLQRKHGITNFAIAKKLNAPKDVDAYYELGATRVSVEVKCGEEESISPASFVVKTAGRVPDHPDTFRKLASLFEHSKSGNKLELAKNKDNTMKDFLLSAHGKFAPASGVEDLNILLVACGNEASVQHWWHCLYGGEGLFTATPFHPFSSFELVDVVLLTNLKYFHLEARQYHDWTLKNTFLLPCINPHGRKSLVRDSIRDGLSIFNHHLQRFSKFSPKWNPADSHVPDPEILEQVKVFHYLVEELKEERDRYFPVTPSC
jgi:hypothetical protein